MLRNCHGFFFEKLNVTIMAHRLYKILYIFSVCFYFAIIFISYVLFDIILFLHFCFVFNFLFLQLRNYYFIFFGFLTVFFSNFK